MSIWANAVGFLCHINRGLGNRDVIGSSRSFTLSLKSAMPCECVMTFETTLVIPKQRALGIGKIWWVQAFH